MMLNLYCTKKRAKQPVTALDGQSLKMYTCGPTVYNLAHIGNLRTFLFEDLLKRTVQTFGLPVNHVMNITDVDDKTIRGALENHQKLTDYTRPFEKAFLEDLQTLNILPASKLTRATDYIHQMIALIETLLKEGVAYRGDDGNVFFSIAKFPAYGALSHLKLSDLKQNASERTATDEYDKDSASDFVLWKAYDKERDGTIFWESPFGKGRPGWHIECSAMAIDALGSTLDIHCGGVDNIFPHHENEIAQSECATGKPFACHWAHAEHLIVDGKKMSKSMGNFYTLRDLLKKGYTGPEIRYTLLATHYRTQLNFTMQGLDASRSALHRLKAFIDRLRLVDGQSGQHVAKALEKLKTQFYEAMADDLNISVALAALFDAIRQFNALIDRSEMSKDEAVQILGMLAILDQILGVLPLKQEEESIPPELVDALEKREEARRTKNWAEADALRDQIIQAGYIIEDSPKGPALKKV